MFALIASTTIALVGQFLISPILVFELNTRGVSAAGIGLFTAASWLGILLTTPFAAAIVAKIGIKPALVWSLVIPFTGLLGIIATDSVAIWLVLYFTTGLGTAVRWIVGEAVIADLAPNAIRGRIVGLFQMLLGASFVVAPTLLAWIGPTNPLAPWVSLSLLACGLLLTAALPSLDNSPGPAPSVGWLPLLRSARKVPLVVTAGFIAGFFELGISSVLPVYGIALGFSVAASALIIAASGAGSCLAMLPVGMAADRFEPTRLMIFCASALLLASALLVLASYLPAVVWPAALIWGGAGGALYTLTMIDIGHRKRGVELINTTAILVLSYTVGGLSGPIVTGYAIEFSVQWAMAASYCTISLAGLWMFSRNYPSAESGTTVKDSYGTGRPK